MGARFTKGAGIKSSGTLLFYRLFMSAAIVGGKGQAGRAKRASIDLEHTAGRHPCLLLKRVLTSLERLAPAIAPLPVFATFGDMHGVGKLSAIDTGPTVSFAVAGMPGHAESCEVTC